MKIKVEDGIAALATQRAFGHLGADAPSDGGLTPNEKFLRAIFGVKKTPEEAAAAVAASAAAASAAREEQMARWAATPAAKLVAAQHAIRAAEAAQAAAERAAETAAKIACVDLVNGAIAALVAEGVLADRDYASQPRVWGLRWSERKSEVIDENSHNKSPEAWALYRSLRKEGTACPERAADLLAEICGLLEG